MPTIVHRLMKHESPSMIFFMQVSKWLRFIAADTSHNLDFVVSYFFCLSLLLLLAGVSALSFKDPVKYSPGSGVHSLVATMVDGLRAGAISALGGAGRAAAMLYRPPAAVHGEARQLRPAHREGDECRALEDLAHQAAVLQVIGGEPIPLLGVEPVDLRDLVRGPRADVVLAAAEQRPRD